MRDPKQIGEVLAGLIARYRLADPDTWTRIRSEWDSVVGHPWSGRSVPLSLQDSELVVEAVTPAAVSMLRYGVSGLIERLGSEFGPDVVTSVRVVPPRRR
jgi:hypothetical protein